ncbi:flavodoxin [Ereboglobus sp. PH5-10]|uniref:flavodoxin n=1 Tax=Ereboglobus sp. PH5-10 TaxID=2940629 RepID=UPI00240524E4|nr:flavodoxin [Ereboglobus sp. PH5-10]MDF9828050.1 flavodoxin [Ereboglobus sp. PH5-10]
MKRLTILIAFLLMTANIHAQEKPAEDKILIAYFSWSGNTRTVAGQIQKTAGGDLFEIKTTKAYPTVYRECTAAAKKEQQENARPELSTKVAGMDDYNIIFVGYPNWWGTMPMPLFTFLESYDFSGKTIIPFCTHEGGRLGRSANDIKKLCPKATVREGLAISGNVARRAQKEVDAWLRKLEISK